MNRRQFIKKLGIGAVVCSLSRTNIFSATSAPPQIAITLDDFNIYDTPTLSGVACNQSILDALNRYNLKAAIFVTGKYIDSNNKNIPLLRMWDELGHMIANHTYSHWYYPNINFSKYTQDILRNETLLKDFINYQKFFRFPYLKEGNTVEQRDKMRTFLKSHGYRNGHVTIDASDWYVDERLSNQLKNDPHTDITSYRNFYLDHLWDRARYYDDFAQKVLGRSVKHTLLLHHNVLNGLFLGDVLKMFVNKGWKLIDAKEAYTDPVFSAMPKIVPAGESIIWALAKETKKFNKFLRYPGEDSIYEKPKMDSLGL